MQDGAGDLLLLSGQFESGEELVRGGDVQSGGLADIAAIEKDSAGFGTEPFALALRAARIATIFREHDAHMQLVLLALHQLEEAVDAEKRSLSIKDEGLLGGGEVEPRHVQRNALFASGTAQLGLIRAILRPRPRIDGALVERLALVRNDEVE